MLGESAKMTGEAQALLLGDVWDRVPHDRGLVTDLVVYRSDGGSKRFSLGAHAPDLSAEDVERIHRLWAEAVKLVGPDVHHHDVVAAALGAFQDELDGDRHDAAVARLQERLGER